MSETPQVLKNLPAQQLALIAIGKTNKTLHSRDSATADLVCGKLRTALANTSVMPSALSEALAEAWPAIASSMASGDGEGALAVVTALEEATMFVAMVTIAGINEAIEESRRMRKLVTSSNKGDRA